MRTAALTNPKIGLPPPPPPLVKFASIKPAISAAGAAAAIAPGPQAVAGPTTLTWSSGRPGNEKTTTTGSVSVAGTTTTQVKVNVSLKKAGAYTFSAGASYGLIGKTPTLSMSLADANGKVIKTISGNQLKISRSESEKLTDGQYTLSLNLTPGKGGTAWLTQYTINAAQNLSPLPAATKDPLMNAVLAGGSYWWHPEGEVATQTTTAVTDKVNQISGAKTTLYYDFLAGSESFLSASDKNAFQAMDNDQQEGVESALSYLSSLVNVTFVKADANNKADIAFGTNEQTSSAGYALYPHANGNNPSVVMLDKIANGQATNTGAELKDTSSYGWYTLIHEVGHAMGLKHPGPYNAGGGSTPGPYLPKPVDNRITSVMSYINAPGSQKLTVTKGVNSGYSYSSNGISPTTYQVLDIAALQYMYGANKNTTASDITLTDSDTKYQAVWAPKGVTVDASATERKNVFDLRAGFYSSISIRSTNDQVADIKASFVSQGVADATAQAYANNIVNNTKSLKGQIFDGRKTLGLAWGSQMKEVKGGKGDDSFYASDYSTTIDGGSGNDTLYLQGTAKLWTSATANGVTTYTNVVTNKTISAKGIEAIKYYTSTSASFA